MRNTRLLLIATLFVLYCSIDTPTHAKTILFQDSFSEGLHNWQQVRPQGAAWQISNNAAYVKLNQTFQVSELVPRADLWNDDWHNIRFELDYTPIRGTDRNISFHFQDLQNWYEFHFTTNTVTVLHLDKGAVVWSTSKPFTLQNDQTYHIELRLHEADSSLFIDDQLISHEHDPTFSNDYGRIALKAGTGADAPTEIQIDNVIVSSYDTTDLGLTPLKQTDARWANQEYDSAATWAEETGIDSWGCALTSLTMIFKHYGISRLPDGTLLTPESFNVWLRTQPDGYIGEGLVNWQVGLRVARASHEQYGTPLLAYKKVTDSWQDALRVELTALRPAIIQLPGHFLVAEGIIESDPFDFKIVDPAFAHTQLSQHPEQPISIRTFVPTTQTLPSIVIMNKPEIETEVLNSDNIASQTIDQLNSGTASNNPLRLTELQISNPGSFVFKQVSQIFQPVTTSILGYTHIQEPLTTSILSHIVGPNGLRYELSLNGTTAANPVTSFAELSADTSPLHQQGLVSLQSALLLAEVFSTAQLSTLEPERYTQLGKSLAQHEQDLAKAYLLQQLSLIN